MRNIKHYVIRLINRNLELPISEADYAVLMKKIEDKSIFFTFKTLDDNTEWVLNISEISSVEEKRKIIPFRYSKKEEGQNE